MIFTSPLPDVDVPNIAVTAAVFRYAEELADKTAVIDGPTGRSYTYGRLYDLTRRAAGGLAARGFGPGDVLAIMAPNVPEYAIAFHAAALLGGISTTINPTYTAEEVEYQLNDAGAKLMVTISLFLETAKKGAAQSPVEEIFTLDPNEDAIPFSSLFAADPVEEQTPVDPARDLVTLPYSSGTTGLPKGVMLTHRNLVANLVQSQHALSIAPDEVVVAVLPFFHIYGMQVLMNGVLHYGGTTVTLPRFDLEQFLQVIQDRHVTQAYVVPPIVLALAKHPLIDSYNLSSLRRVISGAAPLAAEVAAAAAARIGCEVAQGYGLTETSPVTHATPPGQHKAGSIGVAISNTETRVVDPVTGGDLGRYEDGELWIRGPQVMAGYLNRPEATAITIDDEGWLHTGDIGHVDNEDHFFIVDRLKELIKYKGFQVPPAELEGLLLTHPDVADAAVVPAPDLEAGEVPKGFVVLKPGHTASPDELMAFVAGHVAHYKQIRLLELVDEIPKSASGKILRRVLRDRDRDRG